MIQKHGSGIQTTIEQWNRIESKELMHVWLTNLGCQEYEMEKGQSFQKYGSVKTRNNLPNN